MDFATWIDFAVHLGEFIVCNPNRYLAVLLWRSIFRYGTFPDWHLLNSLIDALHNADDDDGSFETNAKVLCLDRLEETGFQKENMEDGSPNVVRMPYAEAQSAPKADYKPQFPPTEFFNNPE